MLEADIKSAIEKNLSSEVGSVLMKRLKEAESDRAALADERDIVAALRKANEDKDKKLRSDQDADKLATALAGRAAALDTRERELEKREARAELNEYKVTAADQSCHRLFALVETIFRKPTILRTISENGTEPAPAGATGQYPQTIQVQKTTQITEEQR